MKYKDNEISYKKAIKIGKRKKLPKKLEINNIDTIYLDTYNYNNALLKEFKESNITSVIGNLVTSIFSNTRFKFSSLSFVQRL